MHLLAPPLVFSPRKRGPIMQLWRWLNLRNWVPAVSARNKAAKRTARRLLLLETLEDRLVPSVSLWTDKPDYSPGQIAIIGGSGFQVGETVQIQVIRTDG